MAERTLTIAVFNEVSGWSLPEELVERISQAAPAGVSVRAVQSRAELLETLLETTYLAGFPLTESQFEAVAGAVRWIQLTGSAGETLAPLSGAMAAGIRVTSASPIRAPQCAEHAIALTLALLRRVNSSLRAQEEHRWATESLAPLVKDLDGATVGLISMGVIGEAIARRLRPFGCEILATGAGAERAFIHVDQMFAHERIGEVLHRADVVIMATPFAPRGAPLLGRREFDQMKDGAILVDVSRGGVVRHDDLIDALRTGKLGGAALDVFSIEPLPGESALWTMPGVILTPHLSTASPRYWDRAADVIVRNLRRIEAGRPLIDELAIDTVFGGVRSR